MTNDQKQTLQGNWTRVADRIPTNSDADPWGEIFVDMSGNVTRISVQTVQDCLNRSRTNDVWQAFWMPTGFSRPAPRESTIEQAQAIQTGHATTPEEQMLWARPTNTGSPAP